MAIQLLDEKYHRLWLSSVLQRLFQRDFKHGFMSMMKVEIDAFAIILGKATPVGFEPTQGDPIGLAGRRLSHSAKVSLRSLVDRR